MIKVFLLCAVLVAVAYAAPESVSDNLSAPVAEDAVSTATEQLSQFKTSAQGTVEDRTKLVDKLFKDYNNKVNPDSVKVKFGVSLIDFHILEDKDAMESYTWLKYVWQDPRLAWNEEEFGGATVLRIEPGMVWKPDITLYNTADPVNMINCWESNVLIFSNGEILWVPPCKMVSRCHLTLRKEPYGEQVCGLKFGSWTFDGFVLDLDFYKGNKTMDLTDLNNASGFEILSNEAERKDKYYPCCKEPYPDLTFNLTIKRIPGEELFKKW